MSFTIRLSSFTIRLYTSDKSSERRNVVSLLIAHGADVNARFASCNTPFTYGCVGEHEEMVRILLDSGADIEDHNENSI